MDADNALVRMIIVRKQVGDSERTPTQDMFIEHILTLYISINNTKV